MFVGMNRDMFRSRLLAELLPPLSPTGQSLLWEALGRRFTGLNYIEADHISRTNKEFIKGLFPEGQIYTCLFSEEVRSVIGAVGHPSEAAHRLLSSIGFAYQSRVDPFDGGPHFEAQTDAVTPVKETRSYTIGLLGEDGGALPKRKGLVAVFQNAFAPKAQFVAAHLNYAISGEDQRVLLDPKDIGVLGTDVGGAAHVLDFNGH
jgi:arginine N-succinyltransferase